MAPEYPYSYHPARRNRHEDDPYSQQALVHMHLVVLTCEQGQLIVSSYKEEYRKKRKGDDIYKQPHASVRKKWRHEGNSEGPFF